MAEHNNDNTYLSTEQNRLTVRSGRRVCTYTYERIGAGASERFLGEMSDQRADVVFHHDVLFHVVVVVEVRLVKRGRRRREMAKRQPTCT